MISWIFIVTGAAYLPLDTSYPPHMLQSILDDALPVSVVTSPEFESMLKNSVGMISTFSVVINSNNVFCLS